MQLVQREAMCLLITSLIENCISSSDICHLDGPKIKNVMSWNQREMRSPAIVRKRVPDIVPLALSNIFETRIALKPHDDTIYIYIYEQCSLVDKLGEILKFN